VSRRGSIDWLCLPRFDSHACFAALLGTSDNGRWLLGPLDEDAVSTRRYLDGSFVLETVHRTATGSVRVTDLMPMADGRADVLRRVEGLEGSVRMVHEWVVRFGYGETRPWVSRRSDDREGRTDTIISAVAGPDMLVLRGQRLPRSSDGRHVDEFDVTAGEVLTFSTTWFPSHEPVPPPLEVESRIEHTVRLSQSWTAMSDYDGPYADAVTRSLLVLRILSHGVTGGIVAAPTTSLPEDPGGVRNWDYRFCWLRDAALTLESLLGCGYLHEVQSWRGWLMRAVAGDPADLQILYRVDGGRDILELELPHLPGYAASKPVRIGNGAVGQRQTDVLGEVMISLEHARTRGLPESADSWNLQRALIDNLADHWEQPDNGLWEIRGPLQHFTHSRAMVWAAFDRAVRGVEEHGLPGPVERWRALREQVRDEVLTQGFNTTRNTFVQHYETSEVDASLLTLGSIGIVDGDDPRMLGTIRGGGSAARRSRAPLPDPYRCRRPPRRRAPLPRLLLLARHGIRPGRDDAGGDGAHGPPRPPPQRPRAAVGGVRPRPRADGGQLPTGLLAPRSRGSRPGARRGERRQRHRPTDPRRSTVRGADVTVAHVTTETERVVATAASLRNDAVLAPSLCPGWSRGHVLTHLARNADALARVCAVALRDEPGTMYPSQQARDDEIEQGARRPAAAQAADIVDSAARLATLLSALGPEHADVAVERVPGGPSITVGSVAFMRLREVALHHVDLDACFRLDQLDPELVDLLLADAVDRLRRHPEAPSVRLVTLEGRSHVVRDGGTIVTGSPPGLLLWVARSRTDDVTIDGPPPTLPFGG
jgi:uncharacterized protein (TIGR03083 family)